MLTPLGELMTRAGVEVVGGSAGRELKISSVADDSRKVEQNGCFVAVHGARGDGVEYIESAARAGAVVVISDRPIAKRLPIPLVQVTDARSALAKLAAAFYRMDRSSPNSLPVIGVTGTNGKTTVAWLLRAILRAAGHRPALLGTIEYDLIGERSPADMTTPGPVDLCRMLAVARASGATHTVMEVSSHALDQRRCDGLNFVAGVFTNLTGDHLDYHGTMEAYLAAKRRLFELLPSDGVAVINADDPASAALAVATPARVVLFGLGQKGAGQAAPFDRSSQSGASRLEVFASDRSCGPQGSRFTLHALQEYWPIQTTLIGRHNISNALAAAGTAAALGISGDAIAKGLGSLIGVPGRLQRAEQDGHPFSVLVDYAHTDDALRNVLQAVRPLTRERLICVFGCGGDRDRTKRPRMAAVVGHWADRAYVTSDNPRTEEPGAIIEEILRGFSKDSRCRVDVEVDRRAAIRAAIHTARPGDTVLIAGKGHERYQLIGTEMLPFDDLEVAQACLATNGQVPAERALRPVEFKRLEFRGGLTLVPTLSPEGRA